MNDILQSAQIVELDTLTADECLLLLSLATVGRIAFVVDGLPMVLPVNYRVAGDDSGPWILLRSRPGRAIDTASEQVAFEIDGIDHEHRRGWSVVARGVLRHLDDDEVERLGRHFDPRPWPREERTAWLAISIEALSGRRLTTHAEEWALPPEAYL